MGMKNGETRAGAGRDGAAGRFEEAGLMSWTEISLNADTG